MAISAHDRLLREVNAAVTDPLHAAPGLRDAVFAFVGAVLALRSSPPAVLISVERVLRKSAIRELGAAEHRELEGRIVRWAMAAYYGRAGAASADHCTTTAAQGAAIVGQ